MRTFDLNLKTIDVAERYGDVPYKREHAINLAEEIGAKSLLLIDFQGARDVAGVFLRNAIIGLQERARYFDTNNPMWAITNTNQDVAFGLGVISGNMRSGVAVANEDSVYLQTKAVHLTPTYTAAQSLTQELGGFTAIEIAETLGEKVPNTNERLKSILRMGALTRVPDVTARRGIRYIYRAITDEDITPQLQLF